MTPTTTTSDAQSSATRKDNRKWTVMVFMGADTIAGNASLVDAARADIAEMGSVGSGKHLNVFVQVHGLGAPKRSHVREGTTWEELTEDPASGVPDDQADVSGGHALECFIRWALNEAGHRVPDDYSMLVLWGHAYDFAIGRARTREGTIDALDFSELSDVLKRLQRGFGVPGAGKLDILGFDACELATVEMACQLHPFASYLLGSQIAIPIPGWPYDRILDRLQKPIGRLMGPAEFGSYIVRRFCESYKASRTVSLTLLDLEREPELFAHAEVLALILASAIGNPDNRDRIAHLLSRSQTVEGSPYVDVADLCLNLVREGNDTFVIEAARALGDFLISPQPPPLVGESQEGTGKPFVIEHGRNASLTARLNGISLYAPHVAPMNDFEAIRPLYQNFVFAQKTVWSGFVHTLARQG
jgi:hypothetical protein